MSKAKYGFINGKEPLDFCSEIFTAVNTYGFSNVSNVSIELDEIIDIDILTKALDKTINRFIGFKVKLKRGYSKYYFVYNDAPLPPIGEITDEICKPFKFKGENGYLFRTLCKGNKITCEFFHALCDGKSGDAFILAMIIEYFSIKGKKCENLDSILDVNQPPNPEEIENSLIKYSNSKEKINEKNTRAFYYKGTATDGKIINTSKATVSVNRLLELSREKKVTINDYLSAALVYAFYRILNETKNKKRPIRLAIPIDMRNHFKSKTLRNFSMQIDYQTNYTKDEFTFDDALTQLYHFVRNSANKNYLSAKITEISIIQKKFIFKIIPMFLKEMIFSITYKKRGGILSTSMLSNFGKLLPPPEIAAHLISFEHTIAPSPSGGPRLAISSIGDKMTMCFSSRIKEKKVEEEFFKILQEKNIDITLI